DPAIYPRDCETRTFMHDLPLADELNADTIVDALNRRKSLIVPGRGIVTYGIVSPEQAFIVYSSVCFAVFVAFFSEYLLAAKHGMMNDAFRRAFDTVMTHVPESKSYPPAHLRRGPFLNRDDAMNAVIEAGRKTVEYELVDSFFGNVSCRVGDMIYISQTSSSLDELGGCIDPCPLDGSSCAGVTASSELAAHREVYLKNDVRAILHGHPKFSVIMSMDCDYEDECDQRGECFRRCPRTRFTSGVPIVPGEVGTGPFGLFRTMPRALAEHPAVIVYGHGVFATGKVDFTDAFDTMVAVESGCRTRYFERLKDFGELRLPPEP
ncbi:MAG TPA: class II aldolase/adducin family protein, partial [bacterium]|nr:class II aldolase/adducin family protein [bacterium]